MNRQNHEPTIAGQCAPLAAWTRASGWQELPMLPREIQKNSEEMEHKRALPIGSMQLGPIYRGEKKQWNPLFFGHL